MKLYEFENFENIMQSILELISENRLKVTYLDISDARKEDYIFILIGCKNELNEDHLTKVIKHKFRNDDFANIRFNKFGDITRISFELGVKAEE